MKYKIVLGNRSFYKGSRRLAHWLAQLDGATVYKRKKTKKGKKWVRDKKVFTFDFTGESY